MKYVIRGERVEVTEPIKKYLIEKTSKLDKYLENPEAVEARILVIVRGREHKVEVTIPYKNYCIRSEVTHSDMYAAIDLMTDKIERQLKKYKTKKDVKKQKKAKIEDIEEYFENEKENVVKRKEIFLKPIDEEEAIIQMELSEHDFYIFRNIEDNSICVLYKRKESDYGIIKVN